MITDQFHQQLQVGVTVSIVQLLLQQRELYCLDPTICSKLVYYDHGYCYTTGMARCMQIKKLSKAKQRQMITRLNPDWHDLGIRWLH